MQQMITPSYGVNLRLSVALLLTLLVWLMAGCAIKPGPMPAPQVRGVQIPPLPQTSRPPARPLICLPSCLHGRQIEQRSTLDTLTTHGQALPPARMITTEPVPH